MANFESFKELIVKLNELTHKINTGELSEGEMHQFVEAARSMHERAVIMQFKAMEQQVFGNSSAPIDASPLHQEDPIEVAHTPEEDAEAPQATQHKDLETKEDVSEGILFDFSLTEEPDPTSIDFSGFGNNAEPIVSKDMVDEKVDSASDEVDAVAQDEPQVFHAKVETPKGSTEVITFYQRFEQVHNALISDRLSNPKIENIRSAFGLNDRLRIIGELFQGNSELFSQTIDELEHIDSGDNARRRLSEIAVQYRWDAENKLVEEFVRVIDRKFV